MDDWTRVEGNESICVFAHIILEVSNRLESCRSSVKVGPALHCPCSCRPSFISLSVQLLRSARQSQLSSPGQQSNPRFVN